MTREEQLKLWLRGKSVHNQKENECCPDFSCCVPECEASLEEKLDFCNAWLKGNHDIISGMMMMFLSGMIIARGLDKDGVHVPGFANV